MQVTALKGIWIGGPGFEVQGANLPEGGGSFLLRTRSQSGKGTYAWIWLGDGLYEAVIEEHGNESEEAALWHEAEPDRVARWAEEELAAKLALPAEERSSVLRFHAGF